MRDDSKKNLKMVRQQINSFCLTRGITYPGDKKKWTGGHFAWLRKLSFDEPVDNENLLEQNNTCEHIEKLDKRIESFSELNEYADKVKKLICLQGIKRLQAITVITEVGDFNRFKDASSFSSFIGLTPSENSSGDSVQKGGITKAGNTHVRKVLVEAAQGAGCGRIDYKSKDLKKRQTGNTPETIAYADRGNERLIETLPASYKQEQEYQCCKDSHCTRYGWIHLGNDDRQYQNKARDGSN